MPSRLPRPDVLGALGLTAAAVLVGCGGGEPGAVERSSGATATTTATTGESQPPPVQTEQPATQPALPPDPSGYTVEYVQQTLGALYEDYREALTAYQEAGAVDDAVRAAMAEVFHPDVVDQQIRNLEDYYPGGSNLEDPPGAVVVAVSRLHSVADGCILAVATYDVDAVTTLDAPVEDDFFIGLAGNPAADPARPWLITVEYTTSDGEPLPEDACA